MKQSADLIFTGMKTIQLLEWCDAITDKPWRKQVNVIIMIIVLLLIAVGTVWLLGRYISVYIPVGCLLTKLITVVRRL